MNFVEPLRNGEDIRDIENYLKRQNYRNYIMFILGIHSGLRISDILKIRIRDIINKDYVYIKETKTSKRKKVTINKKVKKEIIEYCKGKTPDEFLIKSREGYNKPITRDMAYKIIREAGEKFSLYELGCHSMRKTFGYFFYKKTGDVVSLQKHFNHSSTAVTLRYIGIEQEEIDKQVKNLRFY